MKVIAINGSPKKDGNTYHALKVVADELEKQGIETEILHVGDKNIRGCLACGMCAKNKNEKCVIDDYVNEAVQKMKDADGIILASPTYYASIAGTMKSFLDRTFYVAGANGGLFRHKVGAAIGISRRSGEMAVFDHLNHYLTITEMFVASSNYWNVIHGTAPAEVLQDEEGVQIMQVLARNMAYLMKSLDSSAFEKPERAQKIKTNYIR